MLSHVGLAHVGDRPGEGREALVQQPEGLKPDLPSAAHLTPFLGSMSTLDWRSLVTANILQAQEC